MILNDIYSVDLIGTQVWVTKETFEMIDKALEDAKKFNKDEYLQQLIEFNSLSGSWHKAHLHSITGLVHTTKEQRKILNDTMMQYQMEFAMPVMGMGRDAQTS